MRTRLTRPPTSPSEQWWAHEVALFEGNGPLLFSRRSMRVRVNAFMGLIVVCECDKKI